MAHVSLQALCVWAGNGAHMQLTKRLLEEEITQRQEEGYDTAAAVDTLSRLADSDASGLESLELQLAGLKLAPEIEAREPSDLAGIQALRPQASHRYDLSFGEDELLDWITGAWFGRAAGCLLGKPCEGWQHDAIRSYLEAAEIYPLDDYFPLVLPDRAGLGKRVPANWLRGQVSLAPRDDDTDYTILGLHLLEDYGPSFTTRQVADEWLRHLPYMQVYTAERVAYANLVDGLEPPATALYRNPYREWIGAQIRADAFGYVNPGNPEAAAAMAYRDAALSHVKNGIYGEMWVAACLAAAFVEADPEAIILAGLAEIPSNCRLAQALRQTVAWCNEDPDWETTWQKVNQHYGHYHTVHTINNACAVALALLHGSLDFGDSITIAVMCGWDTDCNGATVGSILGAVLGLSQLPEEWILPLNDTIESAVQGFSRCTISSLAERTLAQAKVVFAAKA
jgi:ADP-ribosylglycohydrolase